LFVLINLLMKVLDNGVKEEITPLSEGKIVLKLSKIYGIAGVLSIITSVIFAIIAIFSGSVSKDDILSVLAIVALFLLLGLILVLYSRNTMIEASADKVVYTGLTGKKKEIRWSQIKQVSFNNNSKEVTLKSNSTKIKIHIHYRGIRSLLILIKENVDETIYGQTLSQLGVD